MIARLFATLPLLVAATLYAFVSKNPVIAPIVGVAALVALIAAPYLDAGPFVQRATLLVVGLFCVLGGATAISAQEPGAGTRGPELGARIAVAVLLLVSTRRFFRAPEGGMRPDFGLLTVAVVVAGQRHVGVPYTLGAALFVVATILVVRSRNPGVGWSVVEAHAPLATLGVVAMALSASAVAALGIPRLAQLTQRQFELYVIPEGRSQVGYTEQLGTQPAGPLTPSDTIVLRVYGPHVDYLRGNVYDRYEGGSWDTLSRALADVATGVVAPDDPRDVEVRGVGAMTRPDRRLRYFVPLGARDVATAHGNAFVDPFGVLRPHEDDAPTPVSFRLGAADHEPLGPTAADLEVHPALRPELERLAREWTAEAFTPEAQLAALEQHLSHDLTYTLNSIPATREPAVLHFLLRSHRGRCELFATALALLGRTLGVPTRVVGGFRVAEHNALGGYDVVREKNAHAWVEAWVRPAPTAQGGTPRAEGWRTFDGTPAVEANMPQERRDLAALVDAARALWDRALDVLARAALWQFGVLLALAIALLTAVRVLRARRERARAMEPGEGSLPYYARLERALAALGPAHGRAASEPLEWYAARLVRLHQERAAAVVLEYSALRYGEVGDRDGIAARAVACAKEMEESRG